MKKRRKTISFLLFLLLLLGGCREDGSADNSGGNRNAGNSSTGGSVVSVNTDFAKTDEEMFTDRDFEVGYDREKSVSIQLNGDSVTCSSDAVKIAGTTVTITEEATYILSGTLNDGQIIVNADDSAKLQLVFNGVTINSATSAPLYIPEADKVFVTLAADSTNTLSNGGSFTAIDENNIDAVIFSKQDLTLNGEGALSVSSPAGHGIVSKDDLVITSGSYTVQSASHGLDANDSVRIANASVTVDAGKDGIHAENSDDTTLGFVYLASGTFDIDAEGDGISAGAYLQIEDGTFDIVSGGGSVNGSKQSSDSWGGFMGGGMPGSSSSSADESSTSIKGLKATSDILIRDGSFTIDAADDAVHSNASVTVNGGIFAIASGDDGFHADDTLAITAGKINITESYEGLEAQHVAVSGGDIRLVASDDGLNAAGGTDSSGTEGGRDGMFGGMGGRPGGGGMGGMASSNGSIVISGGTLYVNASGDGLDANGTLTISGGYTTVCGPTQGDTATLDYDVSGIISGGTFIGTGASNMAQSLTGSGQGVVAVRVGSQSAGTAITLQDQSGNTVISHTPELSFQVVILSSPDIVSGETYSITVGSASGEAQAS